MSKLCPRCLSKCGFREYCVGGYCKKVHQRKLKEFDEDLQESIIGESVCEIL